MKIISDASIIFILEILYRKSRYRYIDNISSHFLVFLRMKKKTNKYETVEPLLTTVTKLQPFCT